MIVCDMCYHDNETKPYYIIDNNTHNLMVIIWLANNHLVFAITYMSGPILSDKLQFIVGFGSVIFLAW